MSHPCKGDAIPRRRDIADFETAIYEYLAAPNGSARESKMAVFSFVMKHAHFVMGAIRRDMIHHEVTEPFVPLGLEQISQDLRRRAMRTYRR